MNSGLTTRLPRPMGASPSPKLIARRAEIQGLADPMPSAPFASVSASRLGAKHTRCFAVAGSEQTIARVLYVHGGAFCLLRAEPYLKMAGHLATAARSQVVIPDYEISPESPFPGPVLEVLSVWAALSESGASRPFVLAGDSAGANIALAALRLASEEGLSMPDLVVLFSPWLDLTLSGRSVAENASLDTSLDVESLAEDAALYAAGASLDHPLVSPIEIPSPVHPPLVIQAGGDEILVDDARRLAASAAGHGVPVDLDVAAGMQHNYQFWGPLEPQALRSYQSVFTRIAELAGGRDLEDAPAGIQ